MKTFSFLRLKMGEKQPQFVFPIKGKVKKRELRVGGNRTENQNRRSPEREKEAVAKLLAAAENIFFSLK